MQTTASQSGYVDWAIQHSVTHRPLYGVPRFVPVWKRCLKEIKLSAIRGLIGISHWLFLKEQALERRLPCVGKAREFIAGMFRPLVRKIEVMKIRRRLMRFSEEIDEISNVNFHSKALFEVERALERLSFIATATMSLDEEIGKTCVSLFERLNTKRKWLLEERRAAEERMTSKYEYILDKLNKNAGFDNIGEKIS